jgi:hypothetical protein
VIALSLAAAGCDSLAALMALFGPSVTSVRLVNNTSANVEGTLYFSGEQDIPEDLLTTDLLATEVEFEIAAGASRVIRTESCEDLQAVIIDKAELLLLPGLSPDTGSDVLRDGEDFHCGDEVVFTFALAPDFTVTGTAQ